MSKKKIDALRQAHDQEKIKREQAEKTLKKLFPNGVLSLSLETLKEKKAKLEHDLKNANETTNQSAIEKAILKIEKEIEKCELFDKKFNEATPLTHPGHFTLAYRSVVEKIIKRKKGTKANQTRGEKNYQAVIKIAKSNKIDLMTLAKKNLLPTFRPYFNEEGKKPGKFNLDSLGVSQLYMYQRRFKEESNAK